MKNTIEISGQEVTITGAQAIPSGHGHYKVSVYLQCGLETKTFSAVTNNMPGIDEAKEIEDYNQKSAALYEMIDYTIDNEVKEWLLSLVDNQI